MKKVAIFGNTGAGKSTLARALSDISGLPLYPLDLLQFPGGVKVSSDEYAKAHNELLASDAWIIDGYGDVKSAWERFAVADTLVYIDMPLPKHFLWVTKRFIKGFFATPEGWPEGSPLFRSTLNSYRVLWLCHKRLTPRYRALVSEAGAHKRVYHLKSALEMKKFLDAVRREAVDPSSQRA